MYNTLKRQKEKNERSGITKAESIRSLLFHPSVASNLKYAKRFLVLVYVGCYHTQHSTE
jgi:hypothetical protein